MPEIDPDKLANRHAEQEQFLTMLKLANSARLLVIDDKPGTGKSSLVRILEYNCKWRLNPRVPVSKVLLETAGLTDPFVVVQVIRNQVPKLPFKSFDQALEGWGGSQVKANFNNRGAEVTDSLMIGNLIQGAGGLSPIQEQALRQKCVEAFFEDVNAICTNQQLVLLLDTYDQRQPALKDWIRDTFLPQLCFEDPPERLVVVVAGTGLPDFKSMLGDEQYSKLVRSCSSLTWEPQHVRDFLKANQFDSLSDGDVEIVCRKVAEGYSISRALRLAEFLKERV
jgi:hypothetical protein